MAGYNHMVTKRNFKYASQAKVETSQDHRVTTNEYWRRPLGSVYDHAQPGVNEHRPTKVEPAKGNYEAASDKSQRPSSPVHERPPQVGESITKVQTEVSQPTRPLLSATNWRNLPNSTGHVVGNRNTIREENNNNNNKDYNYQRNDGLTEPNAITNKDHVTGTSISQPTNDTRKVEEAAKSSSAAAPQPRFTALTSTVPKRDQMHERPPEVEEFITRVQTEVSQPARPAIVSATNWRNIPNPTGKVGGNINTYGDEKYNFQGNNGLAEPNVITNKGPPSSGPTDDIEKIVEFLKEAAKSSLLAPAAPQPRFTKTINHKEALKKYKGREVPR